MNTTTFSLSFFLFIIFFTLTVHSPPSAASCDDLCDNYLCDSNWNVIKAGQPFRIGPPPIQGGEVALKSTNVNDDAPCPRYGIMQRNKKTGDKFAITPINPNKTYGLVPLETPFTLTSPVDPACKEETGILRLTKRNKIIGIWHFTVNGIANTSYSCFQFKRFPLPTALPEMPTYLMNYCPYKCDDTIKKPKCYQIGNRTSDGQRFGEIYLTNGGFPFEFAIKGESLTEGVSDH